METTRPSFLKFKRENASRFLIFFWIGFIIYSAAFTISTTGQVNYVLCNLFQIIGLFLIIPSTIFLIDFRIDEGYLKTVMWLYIIWTISVVIRGFVFDYDTIKLLLFNAFESLFIYFVPLIVFFPRNVQHFKKVFLVILISGLIYVLYSVIFLKQLLVSYDIKESQDMIEYFSKTLSIPCGFIILTYIYHNRKVNLFALFVLGLTFFMAVVRARRGLAFLSFFPILVSYIFYLFYSKNTFLKVIFMMLLVIMITLGFAYSRSIFGYFGQKSSTSWFIDRINQDTRSEVEEYFYQDMKPVDWIIGKGINGQYYCPGVELGQGRISIFRRGIETDYLTIILKGGIISLGLILLLAIPAMIKGFFSSRNLLVKAASTWILLYLLCLYPAPVTTFTLNYLIVWISIGLCYSREIRSLTDDDLIGYFSKK